MECGKCRCTLDKCTCPDIDERMASLRNSPHFIYKMCLKCQKHYLRCGCEDPEWGTSHDGVTLEDVLNRPTLADHIEAQRAKAQGRLQ